MTGRLPLTVAIQYQADSSLTSCLVMTFRFGFRRILKLTSIAFVQLATDSCLAILNLTFSS